MLIDREDAAMRLARAVCSDVVLYNGDKAKAVPREVRGTAIAAAVYEGRQLYLSRVVPLHAALFERAVVDIVCESLDIEPGTIPAMPPLQVEPEPSAPLYGAPPHASARSFEEMMEPRRLRRRPSTVPIYAALLFLALLAGTALVLSRMHW